MSVSDRDCRRFVSFSSKAEDWRLDRVKREVRIYWMSALRARLELTCTVIIAASRCYVKPLRTSVMLPTSGSSVVVEVCFEEASSQVACFISPVSKHTTNFG